MNSDIVDVDSEKVLEQIELNCIDKINTANSISFMVNTDGWKILLDTFEQMKDDQLLELSNQVPGDEKAILAAHAVWYSVVHTLDQIVDSVNAVIQDGSAARQTLAELHSQPKEDEQI